MTVKIYDTDSHVRDFTACVTSCGEASAIEALSKRYAGQEKYALELDRTAFFAEGGGQMADRGTILVPGRKTPDGSVLSLTVEDVQEKEGHIYHIVSAPVEAGETVEGHLDWDFRFTNMQQHSGEHILSGIAHAWKGARNVGFHMAETFTTVDFDVPFTPDEIRTLERRANEVVYQDVPVTVFYPTKEELEKIEYRSKKELSGAVRLVKVGDADLCACCAPHVMHTGEVGLIKVVHSENYKGGVRLTILCGKRALEDYEKKDDYLSRLCQKLSTSLDKVPHALEKQASELAQAKAHVQTLSKREEEAQRKALAGIAAEKGSVGFIEETLDQVAARNLFNLLVPSVPGTAVMLIPSSQGYQYVIGSSTQDVRPAAAALKEVFGARGGGKPALVQGTVVAEPGKVFETLKVVDAGTF